MVLISGEAGSADPALEAAGGPTAGLVLYGRCDEDWPSLPAWSEASPTGGAAPQSCAAPLRCGLPDPAGPRAGRTARHPSAPVSAIRISALRAVGAVTSTLRAASELAPVVLGLDDLPGPTRRASSSAARGWGARTHPAAGGGYLRESDVAGARPWPSC